MADIENKKIRQKIAQASRLTLGALERKLADGTLSPIEEIVAERGMAKMHVVMLRDDAAFAKPFRRGRKKGATGAINSLVKKILKAKPRLKNDEIWQAIKDKPPAGWKVLENRTGRYLEGPENKNVEFKTIKNYAAAARKALNIPK